MSVSKTIQANINLNSIKDDKVQITIIPPPITEKSTIFYIPQIVPGTYEYSNFGRFIESKHVESSTTKNFKIQKR